METPKGQNRYPSKGKVWEFTTSKTIIRKGKKAIKKNKKALEVYQEKIRQVRYPVLIIWK